MKEIKDHSAKKNVLGSFLKTAAMIYGFYQLLNCQLE